MSEHRHHGLLIAGSGSSVKVTAHATVVDSLPDIDLAVTIAFGHFEAIAELDQGELDLAFGPLVDGIAQIADHLVEIERADRKDLDVGAGGILLELRFGIWERIPVLQQQLSFLGQQFDFDGVSI